MVFHTQIASIMEVLANAAVAEVCKLVDDDYAVFRLEITQSQKENRTLRRKLQLLEMKMTRERVLASRPSSVKILDRYRGMARGEGHLTGGHRSFVKPAGQNTWRDDQPITVDEGSGTSTQQVIVIESADTEAAVPGVKQERSEGEDDPRQSRDIQTEVAGAPPVATEVPSTAPAPPRTRGNITEGQRTVHSGDDGDGDTLNTGGDDLSCSYATEMDPGNISLGLETQTDLSRGDWNRYSGSVYTEGCQDKKVEVIVVDEVTVKVEGDAPPTWNADCHLGDGHSQGRDFLDYRESLETNLNVTTQSPLHSFRDRNLVSTSMGPSDSHGRVLFDQVLNSNDRARAQVRGGGTTSGNSKEKRFLCMFCNKSFSCSQNVEIHQRVHTGEKPFSCTQCHMRFAQAGHLKRHQMVHTGEKPYSCPQCEKRFSRQDQLKIHLNVHTGERLFAYKHTAGRGSQRGSTSGCTSRKNIPLYNIESNHSTQ
uniref:C2H2-type domain-containing protein n=1 Tax=Oncorhynchus tshawytscha TaxID=74940 RepID=A0AAZ3SB30_ONCTS